MGNADSRRVAGARRRWEIELFLRWIKQALEIKHFYGTSENAVRIQITVALIAFVLLKFAHRAQSVIDGLTQFARLIRTNVLHRRRIDRLGPSRICALLPAAHATNRSLYFAHDPPTGQPWHKAGHDVNTT